MTRDEFLKLADEAYNRIMEINRTKGADYAGTRDALANFKRHAETLNLSPEQIWAVYASKHWDAVMTYCRNGEVQSEPIEGRIDDVILYCFLQLGLVEERKQLARPSSGYGLVGGTREEIETAMIKTASQ